MTLPTINPASGEVVATHPPTPLGEIPGLVAAGHEAHLEWRGTGWEERVAPARRLGEALRRRAGELGRLAAVEMGKPWKQGQAEAEKCAWVCDWAADTAPGALADQPVAVEGARAYISPQPLGVVLGVMPWNFPLWQVVRFAVPAMLAGNAAILKHAPNVCGTALACAEMFAEAGFPEGLLTVVLGGAEPVAPILERPEVAMVTLTGSTRAGREVGALAGRLLKKSVLELGGSDPYVVLADADVKAAANACVVGRTLNTGQSCISAKRWVVEESQLGAFTERVVAQMESKTMGDPLESHDLGPLAREDLRDNLARQVGESVAAGATLLLGGKVPDKPGWWYPPTVLGGVGPGMPAYEEELFGPAAAIIPAATDEEALRIANDTAYGLGAAVFTKDVGRGERLAREHLAAGNCFVNGAVRSDPRLPFGGVKGSGYGRELSPWGLREFVNVKTVWVEG